MKAEELAPQLRIGNLLYYKSTTNIAKVELIHNKHFDCRDEYGGFTPNGAYEPIPLSEEVLLKCGFVIKEGVYGKYFMHNIYQGFRLWESGYAGDYQVGRKDYETNETIWIRGGLKSLHDLQNTFYILIQKEMEVSL